MLPLCRCVGPEDRDQPHAIGTFFAGNPDNHLVEMPAVAWPRAVPSQPSCDHRPEFQHPAGHALVRDVQTAFGEEILYVSAAQSEPQVQPDSVLDHDCWKPMPAKGDWCAARSAPPGAANQPRRYPGNAFGTRPQIVSDSGGRRYSASRSTLHGDVLALARGGAAIGRQARTTRVRTGHTHTVSSAPRWWGRGHLRGRRGSTLLQAGELCLVQLSGRIRRRFRAMGHPAMRRVVGARVSVRRGRRRGCV